MKSVEYAVIVLVALVAGFAGGVVAARFFAPEPPEPQMAAQRARDLPPRPSPRAMRSPRARTMEAPEAAPAGRGGAAAPRTMAAPPRPTTTAQQFQLVDGEGRVRARLSYEEDGPGLSMIDEEGTTRARLGLDEDEPHLRLYDMFGEERMVLRLENQQPRLRFLDQYGEPVEEYPGE
ncbi:MAG: hypothetical protein ACOC7T_03465 [Planctomycetota bacterium]